MIPFWIGVAAVVLLAFGFAALGDLVLARASRSFSCWNESFLVGSGAAATLLFPLSLLLPRGALTATLALVAAAAIVRAGGFLRRGTKRGRQPRCDPWNRFDLLALALVGLCAIAFFILSSLSTLGWDGFQIWATKAMVLYERGSLGPERFAETGLLGRLANYPPLLPTCEALLARLRGRFDFESFQPLFAVFHVSVLVGTFAAARRLISRRLALLAAALVGLLPAISTGHNAGGYADLPVAAFVAATAAAALATAPPRRRPGATAWLAGSLLVVKNEGILLLVVFGTVAFLCWAVRPGRDPVGRLRQSATSVFLLAAMIVLRLGYLRWTARPDPTYRSLDAASLAIALGRIREVAVLCAARLMDWRIWGLFWPAFVLSLGVLVLRGGGKERAIALAVAGTAILFACPYLFTTWPVPLHVAQSYPRLMEQVSPLAAITIAAAYARTVGGEPLPARPIGAAA